MDVVERIYFNPDLDFELKVDFRDYNATKELNRLISIFDRIKELRGFQLKFGGWSDDLTSNQAYEKAYLDYDDWMYNDFAEYCLLKWGSKTVLSIEILNEIFSRIKNWEDLESLVVSFTGCMEFNQKNCLDWIVNCLGRLKHLSTLVIVDRGFPGN
jgi:hypothetical protein